MNVPETVTIEMDIYCPGGCTAAMSQILSAMHACKAKIITTILGIAASAGAVIWSEGDEVRITPGAIAMFHTSRGSIAGKTIDMADMASYFSESIHNCISKAHAKGILTDEEMNDIVQKRKDVYLTYDMLVERLGGTE
jgi:ATP-dependent protease ClpP protease subunit